MGFAKYIERSVRNALAPIATRIPATIKHGPAKGKKIKGGLVYSNVFKKPDKEDFFYENLHLEKKVVYDLGGYIGIRCVTFACQTGVNGKVYCFEPNPIMHKIISDNIRINQLSNAKVLQYGIGDKKEQLTLTIPKKANSMSTFYQPFTSKYSKEGHVSKFICQVDSLDNLQRELKLDPPHFCKIDVEGMEYKVLKGMNRLLQQKPSLLIEMHGTNQTNDIILLLEKLNYSIFHLENEISITSSNSQEAFYGHLYCTIKP